jgi:hypothetical protein
LPAYSLYITCKANQVWENSIRQVKLYSSLKIHWHWVIFPNLDRSVENQSTSSIKSVIVNEDEPIKLLILVWTSIFGDQTLLLGPDCPLHERCELTYNHSKLPHASAVIFHVPDIKWVQQLNQRELNYDLPDLPDLPPGQQRVNVFFSHENPTMLARYYNSNGLARHGMKLL